MSIFKRMFASVIGMVLSFVSCFGLLCLSSGKKTVVSAETLTYTESGGSNSFGDLNWDATVSYEVITESYWDDALGNVVYSSHAKITNIGNIVITINRFTEQATECYSEAYAALVGSSHYEGSYDSYDGTIFIEIPEEIKGVPVTEIGTITLSSDRWSGDYFYNFSGSICLSIPDTITAIGKIKSSSYENNYIQYAGTCEQYLSMCSVDSSTPVVCTDGLFYCEKVTDGYQKSDRITYNGTSAEWKSFCPSSLDDAMVTCSDGIVNPPLPTNPCYVFTRSTMTAKYIGDDDNTISTLVIPKEISGYTVTEIGSRAAYGCSNLSSLSLPDTLTTIESEAFLNCQNLKEIYIPASVNDIGTYAFGFWKNSDGTYSKMSTVTIYCEEGSAAQSYAERNDIHYEIVSEVDFTTPTTQVTTITTTTTTTTTSKPIYTYPPETYPVTYPPETTNTTQRTTTTINISTEPAKTTNTVTVAKIAIDPPAKSDLTLGNTFQLVHNIPSEDAMWYSTDETVATVDENGVVTVVGTGSAAIVVSYDGMMSSVTLNISDTAASNALYGDTNLDGRVDITDAVLLNKAVAGAVQLSESARNNADCDGNMELSSNDAIVLLQFLVHLIDTLPYTE